MYPVTSRAVRVTLGIMLTALAACADEPSPTAPIPGPEPEFAVGDVLMVTNTSGGTDIGSLRWAASHVTGGEVIRFDPSLGGQTIVLDSTLRIQKAVTIEGPAATGITITTGGKGHVIDAFAAGVVTLRNLAITGGNVARRAPAPSSVAPTW